LPIPFETQEWYDDAFFRKAQWKLTFACWPRRCLVSNKWIWLQLGYLGEAVWTGPGTPVFETRWLSKEEFLVAILKGTIC
jgi:hypothetical protein